jgi:hypothetical protein
MVSNTKFSERRRAINTSRAGRADKRKRAKTGTPAFPIHPEGYNPKAPDAKKKNA